MERKCKQRKYFENKRRKKITNGNMIKKTTLIKITPEAYSEQSQKFNTEFLTKILPD